MDADVRHQIQVEHKPPVTYFHKACLGNPNLALGTEHPHKQGRYTSNIYVWMRIFYLYPRDFLVETLPSHSYLSLKATIVLMTFSTNEQKYLLTLSHLREYSICTWNISILSNMKKKVKRIWRSFQPRWEGNTNGLSLGILSLLIFYFLIFRKGRELWASHVLQAAQWECLSVYYCAVNIHLLHEISFLHQEWGWFLFQGYTVPKWSVRLY